MDLFEYLSDYKVLVCRLCRYAVPPSWLQSHLQRRHKEDHDDLRGKSGPANVARKLLSRIDMPLLDPSRDPVALPAPDSDPIPYLEVQTGNKCLECCKILTDTKGIVKHLREAHNIVRRGPGRPTIASRRLPPNWTTVSCQRFFVSGHQSIYFEVISPEEAQQRRAKAKRANSPSNPGFVLAEADLVHAELFGQLHDRRRQIEAATEIVRKEVDRTEVSPWLELTRWPKYLDGHSLYDAAKLADLPRARTEPLLSVLCDSVDRIVEEAHRSVCEDRINVFDQSRINSFLLRPRATDRPLMVKLLKSTYKTYKTTWKRLICFAHRTVQPSQPVRLSHRFTAAQMTNYDRMLASAERLYNDDSANSNHVRESMACLDCDCLMFCISLLDHDLKACLFESTIVGFLAVLGIDEAKGVLRDAYHYTPILSGFIKISQLLVVQYAVESAAGGHVAQPADLLDELRDRFMLHGTRSPFSWACRLRMYGKKVRDSTTCNGYISWTDDNECVSYKDISGLGMGQLKRLVKSQVERAQMELEQLLLLHSDEERNDLGIGFKLHRLVDNASEICVGWNFLQDERNMRGELPDRSDWLLERVARQDWLRDEFIDLDHDKKVTWNQAAVVKYKKSVDSFLRRLFLLIHLTSGQPARGTELLSLRHSNTMQGHHRNIFIDHGMVSTVTSFHKGYTVTGSTKIIHRYLPKQVGELLIYYLWLVLPFWQRLDILALHRTQPASPFLWPRNGAATDSKLLGEMIRKSFEDELDITMDVPSYRHLAIAISRKHLPCGGFKRDYGLEDSKFDRQSTHSSWTAGSIYARGLEEAAGHVEARKAEYRSVSREWHTFLGFQPASLPLRKHTLQDMNDHHRPTCKRTKTNDVLFK